MSNRPQKFDFWRSRSRALAVVWVALALAGCSGSSAEGGAGSGGSGGAGPIDFLPNQVLGFVADVDGALIPFATIGGAATGNSGLTTAAVTPTASGWYPVSADGFATAYVKPAGAIHGVEVLRATLEPIDALALVTSGAMESTRVTVGLETDPALEVTVAPGTFSEDAVVQVTTLDPGLMGNSLEPVGDGLFVRLPFEIRAVGATGGDLQPASGRGVDVLLADAGQLGGSPQLFRFDPDAGSWVEHPPGACSRADPNHVSCRLTHLSQHAGGGTTAPPAGGGTSHAQAARETDRAADRAAKDAAEREQNGEEIGPCDIFTPEVGAAFAAEVDSALAEAANNPSEAAKAMLMSTAARLELLAGTDQNTGTFNCPDGFPADWANRDNPVGALLDAMEQVTNTLADRVLTNPQCPDIDAIEKLAAEAQLLGVEPAGERLINAFVELLDLCDVWEGRVEYSILLPPNLPISWGRDGGARYWTETHDIFFLVHGSGFSDESQVGNFEGTGQVTTDFSDARYRLDLDPALTGCNFDIYKTETLRGAPSPGHFEVALSGTALPEWALETATPAGEIRLGSDGFEINWEYVGLDPMICNRLEDINWTSDVPYLGQIVEAHRLKTIGDGTLFWNLGAGPELPTLWEVLERGPSSSSIPSGANTSGQYPRWFYSGTEILTDTMFPPGTPDVRVVMRWSIVHTDYTGGR